MKPPRRRGGFSFDGRVSCRSVQISPLCPATGANAFNAKRVDFLIVDADWEPCVAIEYQGSGHYKGNARARDAIKRAVCEKADVAFMEVATDGLSAAQVRDLHDIMSSLGPRVSA